MDNDVIAVCEGANMPSTIDATNYFLDNDVLFGPAKAANAGGVAVSALEMTQNSERIHWTFEQVDDMLKNIMVNIFNNISNAADKYNQPKNFVVGANIHGFEQVADAMQSQGIV